METAAHPTPHATSATRAPSMSFSCTSGTQGEVFGGQRAHQPRTVEVPLRLGRIGPLHSNAFAGPVCLDELRERATKGCQRTEGRHRLRIFRVDQGLGVSGRKRKAPFEFGFGLVVDVEDAGGGLLFEPLTGVAGIDPCAFGEFPGDERSALGQHAVQAQAGTVNLSNPRAIFAGSRP